jgi:hypothetical protein
MCYFCPHLRVDAEAAIECISRPCDESKSEFALKHEDAGSRGGGGGEEFEDKGRGDL